MKLHSKAVNKFDKYQLIALDIIRFAASLDASFSLNKAMSSLSFLSTTFAYIWVVLILVCPSILLTDSIGTPLLKVTVVANVCRAKWKVRFFLMLHKSAISFKYPFNFWL